MNKILKFALFPVLLLAGMLVLLYAFFRTPDLSRNYVQNIYADEYSQFLELANGDRIHFRDQGNLSGPVLMMIHGTSASLHTWEPLIDALSAKFRLVSLDLPGHGLSGAFEQRDYRPVIMVKALFSVLDHLGIEQATMMGNSLGGKVAWRAALNSPDRVNAMLLLAPSGAIRNHKSASNLGFKILSTQLGKRLGLSITPRKLIEVSLKQTVVDDALITEEMVDRYWQLLRMQGNRQAMVDLSNANKDLVALKQLKNIKIPTLVIWGEDDQLLPVSMMEQYEMVLPHGFFRQLTNIGHLPQEESVATVSSLIVEFCRDQGC